jgi:molybdopterin-guanine dinucleotide biosynthesis protein MobB
VGLRVRIFGIVGRQNSGKTHLVTRLVRHFVAQGLTVSTIKHTHHHAPEVDRPGSDSARHFEAGAAETVLASDSGWVLFHRSSVAPSLREIRARVAPCDVLLVEGYKQLESLARLEVFRHGGMPLAAADAEIRAVACPRELALADWPRQARRLDLDDAAAIAEFLLAQSREPGD